MVKGEGMVQEHYAKNLMKESTEMPCDECGAKRRVLLVVVYDGVQRNWCLDCVFDYNGDVRVSGRKYGRGY